MAMRVLDWRRAGARCGACLWDRPDSPAWWARAGARLTGPVLRWGIARRVARRGAAPGVPPLVVSIGNLRVGGTGKTPLTIDLARQLAARGRRGVIVTRGWGGALRGPAQVRGDDPRAGDEARLLALAVPEWTVIQAVERGAGLAAARALAPELIVLEDGHQSARAPRHLDAVILDRWQVAGGEVVPAAGPCLPWGPYREGVEGARRAGIWLVEVPPRDETALPPVVGRGGARVLPFRREMRLPAAAGALHPQGWGVLSGVARPERFEAGCAALLGRPPRLAIRCDDHAPYAAANVGRVLAAGRAHGVDAWLTTAKDFVKLAALWPVQPPLVTVELAIVWPGKETLPDRVEERLARRGSAT